MAAKNFPIFHIFCSILFAAITSAAPFGYDCQTTLTFSTLKNNSSTTIIYRDNLNSLLSTLSSNATNEDGFFNSTSGRDRETVYGLFLCRGDVSVDVCKRCVDTAAKDIVRFCPLAKEAVVFYDYCLLCIAITVPLILLVVFITLITVGFARKANGRRKDINEHSNAKSLHYDIGAIQDATNNFSVGNRIGQGGFGDVYKGKLPNGQEIAVKRLSQSSNQGAEEFKSEVLLVAKLQHRNLVRLLGFCLQGLERILIYEFVPNKSLDYYLFDDERRGTLNWAVRLKIIRGIARGLLYLHEDCPLKIVHRDLKPSNILLDAEMNPKISDFGMARIFGAHQTQGNTMRVVGTYGYMSPEYVMYGQYSMKSDVFSFGVLTLEIVTGSKNSSFCESNDANDLLSYCLTGPDTKKEKLMHQWKFKSQNAWKHWKENTPLELIDSKVLEDCYSRNELIRCIQIGLLCVQKDAHKRPTMGSVVLMLRSNSVTLPIPQRPAFFARSKTEIQPKESIFDEYYSSTASMYIDEDQSVTKTMTKDI